MKLRLLNLTDRTVFVKYDHTAELSVLPSAFAALPAGEENFTLSRASSKFNVLKVERQYVVNPNKSSSFRWNHILMPEDCPWRIYRDQVASLVLL